MRTTARSRSTVSTSTAAPRTVGVEEELLLVSAETGAPVPVAAQILAAHAREAAAPDGTVLVAEMQDEMIEVVSAPFTSGAELTRALTAGRALADGLARRLGARASAVASSPLPCSPHSFDTPRYRELARRYGCTGRESLACALHVHVGIESPEEGVAVLNRIRGWLPALRALSANSPFHDGADSGYASYRFLDWHRWPSAGPTDVFSSVVDYTSFEERMLATGTLLDNGMLYLAPACPPCTPRSRSAWPTSAPTSTARRPWRCSPARWSRRPPRSGAADRRRTRSRPRCCVSRPGRRP
ncbi:carboxylate-amine ligase [Rathayibacter sp. VKM Ac-2630]|uniref:carboxylate-amine ligase n=1 Tax=Rathayibacter sp. VKM Ac-2630 TaxID=1938617 RepID=UPI0009C741F5|nr:YbdK family carboxylate-amine ligase [Rathayibacter sp. VKM Ac-2630]OOB90091.1 hypothetical protein B0T42_13720 [Rathayibacter sp. VKM Ac-2630]